MNVCLLNAGFDTRFTSAEQLLDFYQNVPNLAEALAEHGHQVVALQAFHRNESLRRGAGENSAEEWRYWRAMALQRAGQVLAANAEFQSLAAERSYYGFLAADELDLPYALEHTDLTSDEDQLAKMASRSDLLRARELYLVGLDGRGRSEWDAVVAYFTPTEKAQAAILADRWGWHSRAILTAASIGEYDDLSLRYPLPFENDFKQHSSAAQISTPWAYGIARSESLFMRDIRSSAGAIGLMQLMPATGRTVAREINLPYFGLDTLTDPQANIRLGTMYLGAMARRYGGNRVLATAAYNAGPHRVDRWMPEQGSIDARIWIENIPFDETRKYVRRVLLAETIFHWRMTGRLQRLSDGLPRVEALPASTSGAHAAMSRGVGRKQPLKNDRTAPVGTARPYKLSR